MIVLKTPDQIAILEDRGPEETIDVRFTVQTSCDTPDANEVRATAAGEEPCGDFFFRIDAGKICRSAFSRREIFPDRALKRRSYINSPATRKHR